LIGSKKNRSIRDVDVAENDEDQLDGKEQGSSVINMVREPRQIIKMIGIRRIKFFGHVMRHNTFIINIMEGKINGKRGSGRPRTIQIWGT